MKLPVAFFRGSAMKFRATHVNSSSFRREGARQTLLRRRGGAQRVEGSLSCERFVTSSFFLLVVMPLLLVAMPLATSSVLAIKASPTQRPGT